MPLCTQVSSDEGRHWSPAKAFPLQPPPTPGPLPPVSAGTRAVFLPCAGAADPAVVFQAWVHGDDDTLRPPSDLSLCLDFANWTESGALELQPCTNASRGTPLVTRLGGRHGARRRAWQGLRSRSSEHQMWVANRTALHMPGGTSYFRAAGLQLGPQCPSGSGGPSVGGCCMEVQGAETAPGTPADIYACEASAGNTSQRAQNQDFSLASLPSGQAAEKTTPAAGAGPGTRIVAGSPQFCLTALTWKLPHTGSATDVPHGVEPKALVLGDWLVLVGGREGLFAYFTPVAGIGADGLPTPTARGGNPWQRFNIAAHHNEYYAGTDQAFSPDAVSGAGGDDETTGYMGATLSVDGARAIICYDRTVSHSRPAPLRAFRGADRTGADAMHHNTPPGPAGGPSAAPFPSRPSRGKRG